MKSLNALSILLLIILLQGCGKSGTTNATLEVSKGFLVSNTGFDGGLVIVGKNSTTNEVFSHDLQTGLSTTLLLTKGDWIFTAVGWSGGTSPYKKFDGDTYCGVVSQTIINDEENVSLTVDQANCDDPHFGSADFINPTTQTFKKFSLAVTCKSFFDHTSPILPTDSVVSKIITAATNEGFCDLAPEDLKTEVKGMKISVLRKSPETTIAVGFGTECLTSSSSASKIEPMLSGEPYMGRLLRLPTKGIPFIIETFRDESCSEKITQFNFVSGLENPNPNFDHLIFSRNASEFKLFLPASDLRRAYSPYSHLLPSFDCHDGTSAIKCVTAPAANTTSHFHAWVNENNKFKIENLKTCPALSSTASYTHLGCIPSTDGTEITINPSATGTAESITVGGDVYSLNIEDKNIAFHRIRYPIYSNIIRSIGSADQNIHSFFNLGESNDDQGYFGQLGRVRDMLRASGAGGVVGIADMTDPALTFSSACMNSSGSKEISNMNFEELRLETYKVSITNSSITPDLFICDTLNSDAATCTLGFDKRMQIYDYKFSAIEPFMTIDFNCNNKMGRMSSNFKEVHTDLTSSTHQSVLAWNTEDNSTQRFDYVELMSQKDSANSSVEEHRSLSRFYKTSNATYEALTYDFHTRENALNNWEQSMSSQRLLFNSSTNALCYNSETGHNATNAVMDYLLTDTIDSTIISKRALLPPTDGNMPAGGKFIVNDANGWASQTVGTCSMYYGTYPSRDVDGQFPFRLESLKDIPAYFQPFGGASL